ncbi:hypothetical protein BGZ88_002817 [Linnemannia elongata]|uniref:Uncharacterized protein n=1 Tax=Linnemannia elongata AG-77 TaxID=1314771 RepID=A0A197K2R6_9FUNG|nr:hypothetical protein BGZ88_002817 [Linnemannia elongata]KAF9339673.1 hypothetical protein BGZ91_005125 [Linnemannia elongata]OAQ30744.1 hypothetical protein K457DRAFT_136698 [Linnemannia elongata AG-77]
MGKSAKFFKRPTRKEKAVLSLTKGTETSLFDSVTSSSSKGPKKDTLSATANPTISKKSAAGAGAGTGAGGAAHPSKSSLAYKLQLNGGIKAAVKDLKALDDDLVSEDEDMMDDDEDTPAATAGSKKSKSKKEDLDKSKPRPDYVELMYGKQGGGNKRKTFMPKPALIK